MTGKLITLPTDWPGEKLPIMPGDFTKYVPQGLGLDAPLIVRPWDDPLKALSGPNYYGLDAQETDPIRAAPTNLPEGGVVYFHATTSDDDLRTVLSLMGLQQARRDFAAFKGDAADTQRERYLTQLRLVTKAALHQFFGAGAHIGALADQELTMEEAVLAFLKEERSRWNDPPWGFSGKLSGTLGGDGDWAKEALAFGFLVENSNWGVYRVWSRPWLVTK
jgi:hypothetical protein